jgi:hypothetical protein
VVRGIDNLDAWVGLSIHKVSKSGSPEETDLHTCEIECLSLSLLSADELERARGFQGATNHGFGLHCGCTNLRTASLAYRACHLE